MRRALVASWSDRGAPVRAHVEGTDVTAAAAPTDRSAGYGALVHRDVLALTIGLSLSMALNAFEIIGSATAMPAVLADVGDVAFYGAAVAAPLVASLLAAPFGGRFADRFGALRPLLLAFGLFALGLVGTAVAPTMPVVALGRFVQGLGAGALTTLQLVIVARWYAVELRPKMLAVISSAFIIPGIIGPSIAAGIAASVGWRWVFGGMLPILAIALGLLAPAVARRERGDREEQGAARRTLDADHARAALGDTPDDVSADHAWWGPVALSLGIAVTVVAGSTAELVWLPLAVAGVVAAVIGARATLPAGTFAARPVALAAAVRTALFASLAYLTFEAFLPLLLTNVRGESLWYASFPLTVAAFCWTGGSWVQARIPVPRRPRAAAIGGLLEAIGITLAIGLLAEAVPFWVAYPAAALASFGMGLAFTITQAVAVEWAASGKEGAASGAVQLANLLGGGAGTAATAIALAWFPDHLAGAIALGFAGMALAGLGAALAGRTLPTARPAAAVAPP